MTADEIHVLAAWHAPAPGDALDAMRLRLLRTGYTALLQLRRVRH
jgi:hypothetical protein